MSDDSQMVHLPPDDVAQAAAYWRGRFEEERARLAKLWALYEELRAERDQWRDQNEAPVVPTMRVVEPIVIYETPEVENPAPAATPKPPAMAPRPGHAAPHAPKHPAPADKTPSLQPQCRALTADGLQCRSSSRHGSEYCGSHKGYRPPGGAKFLSSLDTLPADPKAADTLPASRGRHPAPPRTSHGQARQCQALTGQGLQCRRDARAHHAYCETHAGYHPVSVKRLVADRDTAPRVPGAKHTDPRLSNR